MRPGIYRHGLLLLLLLLTPTAFAAAPKADFSHLQDDEPEFLNVEQAFVFSAELAADGSLHAQWQMPDGYYLYRHRFGFEVPPGSPFVLGEPEIPPGKTKVDEYFGEVQVYYHSVSARVPVTRTTAGDGMFEASITYQGCADRGLCYPPETKRVAFAADAIGPIKPVAAGVVGAPPREEASEDREDATGSRGTATESHEDATEEQLLAGLLADGNMLLALGLFFVAGLGLAFTPCVLPMVPILSSIIVGQGASVTRARAFTLSLAYVLGMAVTYAALGVLVGLFGASMNLQAALQSPPVLIGFAIVFVLLSFSMFGFYELQLPQAWQNRINGLSQNIRGGEHVGVVIMGSLSSLVVSPCLSAPLAGALIYLSSTGDAWLGGGALLALGLGMGVPLLVIGSSGAHLLPRAGAWMNNVKAVFGVLLLAVAVWLLERVVAPQVTLLLWALLAIGGGVYLGVLDFSPRQGWGQLWKATGAFSFVYGILLLIGAASGARDPLQPLSELSTQATAGTVKSEQLQWRKVRGGAGLASELAAATKAGEALILDFYADWCISCKVMERTVFSAPAVVASLSRFRLLQADVTDNDDQDQELLKQFGLFGPPSMLFFDSKGRELTELRMQGEMDRAAFERHLIRVLSAS